ncbi:MAG: MFS transporter [Chloroflexota bacterium]
MQTATHWLARRTKFFYGWVILPVAILTAVFTSPGQTFMVSVFNPSFRESLNLSLSQLTGAYMFGTLLASLPQSYIGVLMDRFGVRKVTLAVVSAFTLACLFISTVSNLFTIFLAFFFIRMFGQGALELLSTNMLPMWFQEKLGTISGIKNVAINLMISVVPFGALSLINKVGWRGTYRITAGIVFVVMIPLIYFFLINRPDDIGQKVDDLPSPTVEEQASLTNPAARTAFDLRNAMRTRAYWIFAGAWFSWAAIATGITFNLLPIFTAKGFSEEQAAGSFIILMVASAIFNILGGRLADRIKLNYLAFFSFALYGVAVYILALHSSNLLIPLYTGILGLSQGLFGGFGNTVWVRYYGRKHLGKIRGSIFTATVAGSSVVPFLMGLSFDQSGGFTISLLVIATLLIVLSIACLWATPPKRPLVNTA